MTEVGAGDEVEFYGSFLTKSFLIFIFEVSCFSDGLSEKGCVFDVATIPIVVELKVVAVFFLRAFCE